MILPASSISYVYTCNTGFRFAGYNDLTPELVKEIRRLRRTPEDGTKRKIYTRSPKPWTIRIEDKEREGVHWTNRSQHPVLNSMAGQL